MSSEKPKYAFVIIHPPLSPVRTLDTILREKKISSDTGIITFYASYRNLYYAYKEKFNGSKMWGIGFTTAALKRWKEANLHIKRDCLEHNGLMSCNVYTGEFRFPDFEVKSNDYFLVVPSTDAMTKLCFGEKICKSYYYWRIKGVNAVYCKDMNDDSLYKYLNIGYRFALKNIIPIDAVNPVPSQALCDTGNNLLNLTPEELHSGWKAGREMVCEELF